MLAARDIIELLSAERDEQLNEDYSPPEQARKKMRVMENLRFSASFANR